MCGRYEAPAEFSEIKLAFELSASVSGAGLAWHNNIAASYGVGSSAPLIVTDNGERALTTGRFWYVPPFWNQPLKELPTSFNARSERIRESKFFRGAVSERRCLVPMMGWFERSRERRRDYRFAPKRPEPEATKPFACAGVWSTAHDEQGNTFRSFAILTTVANDSALPIHPRMPLVVPPHDYEPWLLGDDPHELISLLQEANRSLPLLIEEQALKKRASRSRSPKAQLDLFGKRRDDS